MALTLAQRASWLTLFFSLASTQSTKFWTYTSRFAESTSTSYYTFFDGDVSSYEYTSTRTVRSKVTPTETPFSTSTYDPYYSYDDDLELIYAYYDQAAIAETDLEPAYDPDATTTETSSSTLYTYTSYVMEVTYTAPASCPTDFTWTTQESVSIPTEVTDQITPLSIVTSAPATFDTYIGMPYETWILKSGDAPLATSTAFYYTEYVEECSTAYSYSSGGGSGGGGGGSDSDLTVCSWYSGCTSLKTWVIIIASIIPSLFVIGFIESWFWFRRLMIGKGCLRFGTISWIMISLWIACFTRSQSARSVDDQKILRERWNQMGSGTAFKLWWKWGFRHAYPVELLGQYSRNTVGIVPAGQPLPQMGQVGGTYPGGPPPPGSAYPSGVPQGQMMYYPPPQGWSPGPPGQAYMPPPGHTYSPPPNGAPTFYGEQAKDAPSVTETTVPSPPPHLHQPVPSNPTTLAEVPSPQEGPVQLPAHQAPSQLPTAPGSPQPPHQPPQPMQSPQPLQPPQPRLE